MTPVEDIMRDVRKLEWLQARSALLASSIAFTLATRGYSLGKGKARSYSPAVREKIEAKHKRLTRMTSIAWMRRARIRTQIEALSAGEPGRK